MYLAVQFDHQPSRVTVEIHDETGDDLLAPEVKPAQAIGAQMGPQTLFCRRHFAPKLASTFDFGPRDLLPDHDVANGRTRLFLLRCFRFHKLPFSLSLKGRGRGMGRVPE